MYNFSNIKHLPSLAGKAALFFLIISCFIAIPAHAANNVDFRVSEESSDDTLRCGIAATIDIYIENDYLLNGMSLGFKIWTPDPDSLFWNWADVGGFGNETGCVSVVGGSRLDPPNEVFDLTGFIVSENDVDGVSPDTIMCGGVATEEAGLETGPLEHMYSMTFYPLPVLWNTPRTLCIDSTFVPPSGAFVFVDTFGEANFPATLWPSGGKCYIVGWCGCRPPMWDDDIPSSMSVEVGATGSVTLSASDPEGNDIEFGNIELSGGSGEVVLDDHGDGTCEVFYTPVVDDTGKAITISVYVRDYNHHYDAKLPHVIDVNVSYEPLQVDCGFGYLNGATGNPITKSDIFVIDGHLFDPLTYSVISGPGSIDPGTGEYSWTPGPADIGVFDVTVGATDGNFADQCGFQVDVVDQNCCPGDANFSGDVNVGDAVMLINYIFKGGIAPKIMNWADANADCMINVGDVVYLIGYVFRGGAAPQLGCVY